MLTKWAKRALMFRMNNQILPGLDGSNNLKGTFYFKDTSGTQRVTDPDIGTVPTTITTNQVSTNGICFGTGTTPPTEDDYCVETPITSGLSFSATPSKHVEFDSTTQTYTLYYDYAVANGGASDITITEMGIIVTCYQTGSIGASVNHYTGNACRVMLERVVFDDPITIPAGESKIIRYQIQYGLTDEE